METIRISCDKAISASVDALNVELSIDGGVFSIQFLVTTSQRLTTSKRHFFAGSAHKELAGDQLFKGELV